MAKPTIDTKRAKASVSPEISPRDPPSKVPVAQSDFEHALSAIDEVMAKEYSTKEDDTSQNEEHDSDMEMDSSDDEDQNEAKEDKDKTTISHTISNDNETENASDVQTKLSVKDKFLSQVHESLKERLYQVANPIPDEDFHQRVRGNILQQLMDEEKEQEEQQIEEEEAAFLAEMEAKEHEEWMRSVVCNTNYDENELVDAEAVKRAKEMREQVRAMASRMKEQQQAILERAIQLVQREIRLLTEDVLLSSSEATDNHDNHNDDEQQAQTRELFEARRQNLKTVQSSLLEMTETLYTSINGVVPRNLKDLKDTVNTIEKEFEKKQHPQSLSQTEKAIISRTNEGKVESTESSTKTGDCDYDLMEQEGFADLTSPEFLLADFLSRY